MSINFQKPFFNLCHSNIDDNGGFHQIPDIKVDLVNSYGTIHGFKDNFIDGQENDIIKNRKLQNVFLRRTENPKIHSSHGILNLENVNKTEIQSLQKKKRKLLYSEFSFKYKAISNTRHKQYLITSSKLLRIDCRS